MKRTLTVDIKNEVGKEITLCGWVHKLRKLGGLSFIVLRDRAGLAQAVVDGSEENNKLKEITTETVVKITGKVVKEERAPHGAELHNCKVEVISPVKEDIPIEINKKEIKANLDTLLDNRPLTLRAPKQRAIFRVQSEITNEFREFLEAKGFKEVNTPKIVSSGLETGGAEMFELKYFKKKAFLSQSPQMYKQIMVGVFEKVYETAYIYRAEKHSTSRHINEYVSLDMEMGFIDSYEDIMNLEEGLLKSLIKRLKENSREDFEMLGSEIPEIKGKIPRMRLKEAQEILEKEYGEKCVGAPDLEPKHEKQICEYTTKKYDSEFVFITHYPSKKRPFYTMDDPDNPEETLSFDLLFRGIEVTTGGQRIHLYQEYIDKLKGRGMDPKDFEDYLSVFKFGMPPHGGLGMGLERLTMKLMNLDNIREASLFPRDINRLRP
ncbi:aspartate--tRNA(Asn) ligase [candidate division WS5 bacterium]|uniref:Aspartate--tRNA(Asp/Asn) ligase n=1 Tax=candidate division WS5 bacterium TaxID=2093353 RepID=A0A419DA60_9BACT|nr:MAG: aspartate--tRNA(Asn) ligase [candidate division WS5 bacterium]